jgi:magnesium-protoporphyrin IX monomethyl ester (oxidative) cyclase
LTIVDDIPSPSFFEEVLPRLAEQPLPVPMFCEVRPEISREHIHMLATAGANVQPGIESLHDNVLQAMRKGSRALEDIRLLRWCREAGMTPIWNLMCGVPGERPEDYDDMLAMVPALRFLQPPDACGPVRLDRFSTYAADPASYGWHNVRPLQAYRYIYPFPESCLMRIAYAFEYDWEPGRDPARYIGPLQAAAAQWRHEAEQGEPRLEPTEAGAMIVDTRADGYRERRLDDLESALITACDAIGTRAGLEERMARLFPREPRLSARIDTALAKFLEERVMVRNGDRYLSLVLGVGGPAEDGHEAS